MFQEFKWMREEEDYVSFFGFIVLFGLIAVMLAMLLVAAVQCIF